MTGPSRRPRNVVRHQPYLRAEDSKRLVAHCAATNTTESAVIREALARYWEDAPTDASLVMARLDRALRAQARTQRDLELLTETFALFLKVWFAHTPAVAEQHHSTARSSSDARYTRFVEYVSSQFSSGRRFLDDLPREVVADERELAAIAASAGAVVEAQGEREDGGVGAPSGAR